MAKTKGAAPGVRQGAGGAATGRAPAGRTAATARKAISARAAGKPTARAARTPPAGASTRPGAAPAPAGRTAAARPPREILAGKPAADRAPGKATAKPSSPGASARRPAGGAPDDAGAPTEPTGSPGASARGTRSAPTQPGVLRERPGDGPARGSDEPDEPVPPAGAADDAAPADDDAAAEPLATRDIARLLRYGERIGGDKIDVRMLPLQFRARSGALAVCDPGRPETWRVLERPIGSGAFRVMLSVARPAEDGGPATGERLAAVVIHVGRPPIARWTVAQLRDQLQPGAPDAGPRTPVTGGWLALLDAGDGSPGVIALPPPTGVMPVEVPLTDGRRALAVPCGNGAYAVYWALDAADRPICAVIDLDAFTQKAWRAKPPRPA